MSPPAPEGSCERELADESEKVRFFSGVGVNSADIGVFWDRANGSPIYDVLRPRGTCLPPLNILNISVLGPPLPDL